MRRRFSLLRQQWRQRRVENIIWSLIGHWHAVWFFFSLQRSINWPGFPLLFIASSLSLSLHFHLFNLVQFYSINLFSHFVFLLYFYARGDREHYGMKNEETFTRSIHSHWISLRFAVWKNAERAYTSFGSDKHNCHSCSLFSSSEKCLFVDAFSCSTRRHTYVCQAVDNHIRIRTYFFIVLVFLAHITSFCVCLVGSTCSRSNTRLETIRWDENHMVAIFIHFNRSLSNNSHEICI